MGCWGSDLDLPEICGESERGGRVSGTRCWGTGDLTLTYQNSVGESERGGRVSGTRWWGAGDLTLTYLRSVGESERGGRVSGTRWWGAGDLDRNLCWLALASGAGDRDLILFSGPGDLDLWRLLSGTSRVSLVFGTRLLLSGTSLETGTEKGSTCTNDKTSNIWSHENCCKYSKFQTKFFSKIIFSIDMILVDKCILHVCQMQ